MNTIVAPSNTVIMSSRKIAEFTSKHHHVVCDIKVMVTRSGNVTLAEQLQGITL